MKTVSKNCILAHFCAGLQSLSIFDVNHWLSGVCEAGRVANSNLGATRGGEMEGFARQVETLPA